MKLRDKMDLSSYLLKPVQRMSKYALLLTDLMKEVSSSQEAELSTLQAATSMVKFQLRHGNDLLAMDAIRDCDVGGPQSSRWQKQRVDSDLSCLPSGEPQGAGSADPTGRVHRLDRKEEVPAPRLPVRGACSLQQTQEDGRCSGCLHLQTVLQGEMEWRASGSRRAALSRLLFRLQTADVGLTESTGNNGLQFEIWFRRRRSKSSAVILQALTAEVKNAWTADITKILWAQANRNKGRGQRSPLLRLPAGL